MNGILNREYKPRNIKARFETKTAFVTMNTQRDCEEFILKFNEYAKSHQTNITYSVYKSKVDRINQGNVFKKFNNFNNTNDMNTYQQGMYRSYNDLINSNPQASK